MKSLLRSKVPGSDSGNRRNLRHEQGEFEFEFENEAARLWKYKRKGAEKMSDYILEMNHITKEFSGVKALDDVNL
ncbi:hypothetical protein MSA92_08465, partial [bacterium]|nr:hypothetical protein [bacterium]